MKVTPLAQGTGVPTQAGSGQTSPSRLEKAKAIASGQEVPQTSGDAQVDRTQEAIKKIKMKTQVSTNRDDLVEQPAENNIVDTVEPAQVAEETKPLSPQFAALARQKRALQVKESELARREEALKTQVPAGSEDVIARLKANPLGVLQEAGVSYDQLTEAIINNQNAPIDPLKLRNEIKDELKKELLGEFGTRDQQAEQQVLGEIKREVVSLVESEPEQFEAIREAKAHEDVKELIHRTWKTTGEVLDTREAAELVENQLIDEALPFAKLSKVQSRLTPAQEAMVAQIPTQKPNTKVMRTLTNRDSASPIMDRRSRAIAAMTGTLKKG
jgi:hypothetical protein